MDTQKSDSEKTIFIGGFQYFEDNFFNTIQFADVVLFIIEEAKSKLSSCKSSSFSILRLNIRKPQKKFEILPNIQP